MVGASPDIITCNGHSGPRQPYVHPAVKTTSVEGRPGDTSRRTALSNAEEEDAPYPFDTQSSSDIEDIENGVQSTNTSLKTRFAKILRKFKGRGNNIDQIVRSLDEFSAGYGKVAAIQDLEPDFLMYRRFSWLRNYVLLHLQDELVEMQDSLERLDRWEFGDGDHKALLSRRRDYRREVLKRKDILTKVRSKLAEYDEILLRTQKVQALKRPTKRAQRNLHRLIETTESLVEDESRWTRELPDLAALGRGPEYSWLNTFLEDLMNMFSKHATRAIFRNAVQRRKTGSEDLQLLAPERFDALVRVVLTLVASVLLLIPVSVLFKLQPTSGVDYHRNGNYQILTVFLFTLLFSASVSLLTKANRQEVFAITAAYSAVLVVFLGNTSNVSISQKS